jgi:asparagine synthase (glutamine-hydrolysing)
LWEQPKHGFDFPFLHLMTSDDCALVRQYLDPQVTGRWDLFDREQIRTIKDTFLRGDWRSAFAAESPAFKVWGLVILFAWLENHYRHL